MATLENATCAHEAKQRPDQVTAAGIGGLAIDGPARPTIEAAKIFNDRVCIFSPYQHYLYHCVFF